MKDDTLEFNNQVKNEIDKMIRNQQLKDRAFEFLDEIGSYNYVHHFKWMGLPIIQCPQDIVAMQELIWDIKPDLIIETGVARGGSVIFYSSMLELLGNNGKVIGIDIDIREHNKKAIEQHTMYKNIHLIEGSSIDKNTVCRVKKFIDTSTPTPKSIIVLLDSNHTHDHVLQELKLYSDFVSINSYLVVFDTVVEDVSEHNIVDRPWGKGNNPKTAVMEFLKNNDEFQIDSAIDSKLLITAAPSGYLKRIK